MTEHGSPAPPALVPHAVRAVVFDLDGTLVDSFGPITAGVNYARAHFDLAALPRTDVCRSVGRGLEALIADLVGSERVEAGVRLFRERYAEVCEEGSFALPKARPTLERLRQRGYGLAVASNKPARFSTPILARLNLLPFLDCVAGPDTVGTTKPEPTMIRHCLRELGAEPAGALYVGDMPLDVDSARRAGVPVVLMEGGPVERELLRRTGQRILRQLDELTALLPGVSDAGQRSPRRSPS